MGVRARRPLRRSGRSPAAHRRPLHAAQARGRGQILCRESSRGGTGRLIVLHDAPGDTVACCSLGIEAALCGMCMCMSCWFDMVRPQKCQRNRLAWYLRLTLHECLRYTTLVHCLMWFGRNSSRRLETVHSRLERVHPSLSFVCLWACVPSFTF